MIASRLLGVTDLPGGWQLLRLETPGLAPVPGQWLRLRLAGRQLELAVMQHSADWSAALLPPPQAAELALRPHQPVQVEGPFGGGAEPAGVILGQGPGLAAALYAARTQQPPPRLVVLATDQPLPFRARPSQYLIGPAPAEAIAAAPMLEDAGIPSRIAHPDGLPGCFEGDAVGLLVEWWQGLELKPDLRVLAFGPQGLERRLAAVADHLPQTLLQPVPEVGGLSAEC